jgi:hypothetical protein
VSLNEVSQNSITGRVADLGSDTFLTLDSRSGMGKKIKISSSRIMFPRAQEGTCFWIKVLQFFDANPDLGSFRTWIRDGKNSYPGSGMNISDPQLGLLGSSVL